MAVIEQEVKQEAVRQISIPLSREQEDALTRAASQAGQSVEEFAASAALQAAEDALNPALSAVQPERDPLDSIFGIFKDEPLMEALMERIHEEQQRGIEQFRLEAEAEDTVSRNAESRNAEAQG